MSSKQDVLNILKPVYLLKCKVKRETDYIWVSLSHYEPFYKYSDAYTFLNNMIDRFTNYDFEIIIGNKKQLALCDNSKKCYKDCYRNSHYYFK